jgi:hypothetical protein
VDQYQAMGYHTLILFFNKNNIVLMTKTKKIKKNNY